MRLSPSAASLAADAVLGQLDGGSLELYDGPTLLVALRLGRPAFSKARDGAAVAQPIAPVRATGTGTATSFRMLSASGAEILTGTVGPDNRSDLVVPVSIQASAEVVVDTLEYVQPR